MAERNPVAIAAWTARKTSARCESGARLPVRRCAAGPTEEFFPVGALLRPTPGSGAYAAGRRPPGAQRLRCVRRARCDRPRRPLDAAPGPAALALGRRRAGHDRTQDARVAADRVG